MKKIGKFNCEIKSVRNWVGREGHCVQCDIWVNGHKLAFYSDDEWGGEFRLEPVRPFDNEFDEFLEALKNEPKKVYEADGAMPRFETDYDANWLVTDLLQEKEEEKMAKRNMRAQANKVIIGKEGESIATVNGYRYYKFNRNLSEYPVDWLRRQIASILHDMKSGEKLLNENLPFEVKWSMRDAKWIVA